MNNFKNKAGKETKAIWVDEKILQSSLENKHTILKTSPFSVVISLTHVINDSPILSI